LGRRESTGTGAASSWVPFAGGPILPGRSRDRSVERIDES